MRDVCAMRPDILLLQETNVSAHNSHRLELPSGWAAGFSSAPCGRHKGTAVLCRRQVLPPNAPYKIAFDSSSIAMDVLGVSIGGVLFVSIYVHANVGSSPTTLYEELHEALLQLPQSEGEVVLAGDFNHPQHIEALLECTEALGFAHYQRHLRRHHVATHVGGNVLDWCFFRGCRPHHDRIKIERQPEDHHMLVFEVDVQPMDQQSADHGHRPKYRRFWVMPHEDKRELALDLVKAACDCSMLSDVQQVLPRMLVERLGQHGSASGRVAEAWWSSAIEHARRAYRRAAARHRDRPSATCLAHKQQLRREYRRLIRRGKRRALYSAALKVARGQEPMRILGRGQRATVAHQRTTVHNAEAMEAHWRCVFRAQAATPPTAKILVATWVIAISPRTAGGALLPTPSTVRIPGGAMLVASAALM